MFFFLIISGQIFYYYILNLKKKNYFICNISIRAETGTGPDQDQDHRDPEGPNPHEEPDPGKLSLRMEGQQWTVSQLLHGQRRGVGRSMLTSRMFDRTFPESCSG